jgi:hypothetical protein
VSTVELLDALALLRRAQTELASIEPTLIAAARATGISWQALAPALGAIFRAGPRFIGRTVGLAGAHATGQQLATLFANVLGEEVVYRPITLEQLRTSGAPLADEVANMFQFYVEAADAFVGNRDLDQIRKINPRLRSLDDWTTG